MPINNILYGNTAILQSSAKIIRDTIASVNLQQPIDIKASHSLWASLGENVFSHHKTFFVNPKIFNQQNLTISDNLKKEIISSAVAMNNNYDTKLAAASIATPIIIWALTHYANKLILKLNTSKYQSAWTKKIAAIAEQCEKSFYIKSGISLGIIIAYTAYQKYHIASITQNLIAKV